MLALAVTRSVHFAATLLLAGGVVFRFGVLARGSAERDALRAAMRDFLGRTSIAAWLAAVVSGAVWVFLLAGEIAGTPPLAALHHGIDRTLLAQTQFGQVWQLRGLMALLVLATLFIAERARSGVAWKSALAVIAALAFAGSLAWSGHGAATPGPVGVLHLVADIAHLIAASLWLGGLAPLSLLLWRTRHGGTDGKAAREATRRFAGIAVVSVLVLLASGIVNTLFLVSSVSALIDTLYGRLLLAKIALFVVMLAFAAVNRLRLTPAIGQSGPAGPRAAARMAVHSACELALGLAILAVVGVLGMLPPSGP